MTTTTIHIAGAEVTVPTAELFRAWFNQHLNTPQAPTAASPALNPGEVLVGRINDNYIILLPGDVKANWKEATEWALSIGGELPDRVESALLFATLKDEFEKDWYWTREQHASHSAFAWMQSFGNGRQSDGHKAGTSRARAIRRLPIHPFSPLAGV